MPVSLLACHHAPGSAELGNNLATAYSAVPYRPRNTLNGDNLTLSNISREAESMSTTQRGKWVLDLSTSCGSRKTASPAFLFYCRVLLLFSSLSFGTSRGVSFSIADYDLGSGIQPAINNVQNSSSNYLLWLSHARSADLATASISSICRSTFSALCLIYVTASLPSGRNSGSSLPPWPVTRSNMI